MKKMDKNNRKTLGSFGEEAAVKHLINNKYTILKRNFRVGRLGEIDIIAEEGSYICFIEVKTRRNLFFGIPSEAVTKSKQKKILILASIYISNNHLYDKNARFDVVEVLVEEKMNNQTINTINIIKNAFRG